jgi:hypothetical protein
MDAVGQTETFIDPLKTPKGGARVDEADVDQELS